MVKIKLPRGSGRGRRRRESGAATRRGAPGPAERAHGKDRGKNRGKDRRPAAGDRWLYGHHAVAAALANPDRRPERLLATRNAAEKLGKLCPSARPEIVDRETIDAALPAGAVHQGIALLAPPLPARSLDDLAAALPEKALIVALDQVTDPQNLGAILRSAAAFGACAVVTPRRHTPPLAGVVAKAASGALEHVPVIAVGNLERALQRLKQEDFWCLGLDAAAARTLAETEAGNRVVLVMGAEGGGLRRLTAERCDQLVRLPMRGPLATLNVSNAAAVALYELARRETG